MLLPLLPAPRRRRPADCPARAAYPRFPPMRSRPHGRVRCAIL